MDDLTLDDGFLLEEARLDEAAYTDDQRRNRQMGWLIAGGLGALLLIAAVAAVIIPLIFSNRTKAEQGGTDFKALSASCDTQVKEALNKLEQTCLALGLDEVCYGNNTLRAKLTDASARFNYRGDIVPVSVLQNLQAAPLNINTGDWGIAVFKTQAVLPRTVPGQAVTFLVFGDTEMHLADPNHYVAGQTALQAFYFSTGYGSVGCESIDVDGILVQTPDDSGTVMTVNGVKMLVAGTVLLEAAMDDAMRISLLQGMARVASQGLERDLRAGEGVTVPLGGLSGLDATGAPSQPTVIDPGTSTTGCALLGIGCTSVMAPSSDEMAALSVMAATPVPVIDVLDQFAAIWNEQVRVAQSAHVQTANVSSAPTGGNAPTVDAAPPPPAAVVMAAPPPSAPPVAQSSDDDGDGHHGHGNGHGHGHDHHDHDDDDD